MAPTENGYAPKAGYLGELMAQMPQLRMEGMPSYTIKEYEPLLDSSDMMPRDWWRIAEDIEANYDDYDGFIVIHGTDTMAYTASALAFMLEGLTKPVVLTGSQIPLCEVRSDARDHLVTSLMIAANYVIPEVCLFFGNQLYRGCRTMKVSTEGFDAFASPNYRPIASAGVSIDIDWPLVNSVCDSELIVPAYSESVVGSLRLFPGISAVILANILQPPLQGLVLETFGSGNAPSHHDEFHAVLKEAIDRGVVIVNVTQCFAGSVRQGDYVGGNELAQAGVVSGFDMTAEAALAKLYYLFSRGYVPEKVRELMQENLRGELER